MRLAVLLVCSSLACGQSPSPSASPTTPSPSSSSGHDSSPVHGHQSGSLEVLTDTQGVDFGPYLTTLVTNVRSNWYRLIPESVRMRKGRLAIDFAIMKDGHVQGLVVRASSGDPALDRPAYGSITASNPFQPLPTEFTGPYIELRMRFYYNPDKADLDNSGQPNVNKPATAGRDTDTIELPEIRTKTKSGIAVTISGPASVEIPLGGSLAVNALVTGTGDRENRVDWTLSGLGCSGAACGEIAKDSYRAPSIMPDPPYVTLTAVSKVDPTAKASVTFHIVASTQ